MRVRGAAVGSWRVGAEGAVRGVGRAWRRRRAVPSCGGGRLPALGPARALESDESGRPIRVFPVRSQRCPPTRPGATRRARTAEP